MSLLARTWRAGSQPHAAGLCLTGICRLETLCVLLLGQSKRRFLSIPGRVPGVLCSGLYLELQTVPGEALGWDCSYCWWCWVLGHDLVPGTQGSSWVSLAHLRAPA